MGDAVSVAWAVLTAMVGVALTSIGVAGYLFTPLTVGMRVLFVVTGIVLLTPADVPYSGGIAAEALCLVIAGGLILLNRRAGRAEARPAVN